MSEIVLCLILLLVANGAPIIAQKLFRSRFDQPLDGGYRFVDGKPMLGPSKTIRGLLLAILATALASWILQHGLLFGAQFGLYAMLGDLFSSFVKRRLSIPPSGMSLGLDQIPEALFPALAFKHALGLDWRELVIIVCAFIVIELVLSRFLYKLRIRKKPY